MHSEVRFFLDSLSFHVRGGLVMWTGAGCGPVFEGVEERGRIGSFALVHGTSEAETESLDGVLVGGGRR